MESQSHQLASHSHKNSHNQVQAKKPAKPIKQAKPQKQQMQFKQNKTPNTMKQSKQPSQIPKTLPTQRKQDDHLEQKPQIQHQQPIKSQPQPQPQPQPQMQPQPQPQMQPQPQPQIQPQPQYYPQTYYSQPSMENHAHRAIMHEQPNVFMQTQYPQQMVQGPPPGYGTYSGYGYEYGQTHTNAYNFMPTHVAHQAMLAYGNMNNMHQQATQQEPLQQQQPYRPMQMQMETPYWRYGAHMPPYAPTENALMAPNQHTEMNGHVNQRQPVMSQSKADETLNMQSARDVSWMKADYADISVLADASNAAHPPVSVSSAIPEPNAIAEPVVEANVPSESFQDDSEGTPYLGCTISLVSNASVRYVGTLNAIDGTKGTVLLTNVKCYGTEGRISGPDFVPATSNLYESILFRGQDISELAVLESTTENEKTKPLNDPAIVQAVEAKLPNEESRGNRPFSPAPWHNDAKKNNHGNNRIARGPPSESHDALSRASKAPTFSEEPQPDYSQDFDFASANAKFNKDDIAQQLRTQLRVGVVHTDDGVLATDSLVNPIGAIAGGAPLESSVSEIEIKYDKKKSFFDDLSRDNSVKHSYMRKRDIETFGSLAARGGNSGFVRGFGRGGSSGSSFENRRGRGGRPGRRPGQLPSSDDFINSDRSAGRWRQNE